MSCVSESAQGIRVRIYVQPGASRNQVVGLHSDSLKIKINAPPQDGRANAELIAFLAKTLKIAKGRLNLVSGASSRHKVVEIENVTAAQVLALIPQS